MTVMRTVVYLFIGCKFLGSGTVYADFVFFIMILIGYSTYYSRKLCLAALDTRWFFRAKT